MEIKKKKCHICKEKIEGLNDEDFKKKYNLHLINKHAISIAHISWEGDILKIHKKEIVSDIWKKLEEDIKKSKELSPQDKIIENLDEQKADDEFDREDEIDFNGMKKDDLLDYSVKQGFDKEIKYSMSKKKIIKVLKKLLKK